MRIGFVDPGEHSGLSIFKVRPGHKPKLKYSGYMNFGYTNPRKARTKIKRFIQEAQEKSGGPIDLLVIEDQFIGINKKAGMKILRRSIEFEEAAYRLKIPGVARIMPTVWQSRFWKYNTKPKKDKATGKPSKGQIAKIIKGLLIQFMKDTFDIQLNVGQPGHVDQATSAAMGHACLKHPVQYKVT